MNLEKHLNFADEAPQINVDLQAFVIKNKKDYIKYFDNRNPDYFKQGIIITKIQDYKLILKDCKNINAKNLLAKMSPLMKSMGDKIAEDINDNKDKGIWDPEYENQNNFDVSLYKEAIITYRGVFKILRLMSLFYQAGGEDGLSVLMSGLGGVQMNYNKPEYIHSQTKSFREKIAKINYGNSNLATLLADPVWFSNMIMGKIKGGEPAIQNMIRVVIKGLNNPNTFATSNTQQSNINSDESDTTSDKPGSTVVQERTEKTTREESLQAIRDELEQASQSTIVKPNPSQPFYGQSSRSAIAFVGSTDARRNQSSSMTVERISSLDDQTKQLYSDIIGGLSTVPAPRLYHTYRELLGLKSNISNIDQSRYTQTVSAIKKALHTYVDTYISYVDTIQDNTTYQSNEENRPFIESLLSEYASSYEPGNIDQDKRLLSTLYSSLR